MTLVQRRSRTSLPSVPCVQTNRRVRRTASAHPYQATISLGNDVQSTAKTRGEWSHWSIVESALDGNLTPPWNLPLTTTTLYLPHFLYDQCVIIQMNKTSFESSFGFSWNNPSQNQISAPITAQCETINIKWDRAGSVSW